MIEIERILYWVTREVFSSNDILADANEVKEKVTRNWLGGQHLRQMEKQAQRKEIDVEKQGGQGAKPEQTKGRMKGYVIGQVSKELTFYQNVKKYA